MRTSLTTQTGYVNRNGQATIRNTDLPGNDHLQGGKAGLPPTAELI